MLKQLRELDQYFEKIIIDENFIETPLNLPKPISLTTFENCSCTPTIPEMRSSFSRACRLVTSGLLYPRETFSFENTSTQQE